MAKKIAPQGLKNTREDNVGYQPTIYKTNNDNFIETIYRFVENWHEISINKNAEKINFGNIFKINISNKINDILNFLIDLNHSSIYGKKRYIYNGFYYIFKPWSKAQNIFFDKKLDILFLFQEGSQDFYYGIKQQKLAKGIHAFRSGFLGGVCIPSQKVSPKPQPSGWGMASLPP